MTLKSIIIGLLIFGVLLITIFFYFIVRTKTKDLSNKYPYNTIIDKTLKTKQESFITIHKHSLENPYIIDLTNTNFYKTSLPIYKLPMDTS